MLLVLFLYACFGSIFVVGKFALAAASPFFIVGSRMTVAGLAMLAYKAWQDPSSLKITLSGFLRLLVIALVSIYLCNTTEFWGLQYLTASKACLIYSISPFMSALLAYIILKEKLSTTKWIGLVMGFCGMLPILLSFQGQEEALSSWFVISWPEIALLTAATSACLGWILMGSLIRKDNLSPFAINGYSMAIGGAVTLVHSAAVETWQPVPVSDWTNFLLASAGLIIISNFIGYNLYGYLLRRFSATFMSFAGLTTPLFAAFFGWLFLNEHIALSFWISLAFLALSLTIFHKAEQSDTKLANN